MGINNGNFERGVTDAYAAIPEHVTATSSGEAVFLQWKQRDGQRVAVYKQGEDVPVVTTEPGVNTVTISDLEPNVPVTFVLKGKNDLMESEGVTVTAMPYARRLRTLHLGRPMRPAQTANGRRCSTGGFLSHRRASALPFPS